MAKKSVSPDRIVKCLPHVRKPYLIAKLAFVFVNLFELAVHATGGEGLTRWFAFSGPITAAMSHFFPVFQQLPEAMRLHQMTGRTDIVLNAITWNWVTYLSFILICSFAAVYDFVADGKNISYSVREAFEEAKRDFFFMFLFYFLFAAAIFVMMSTQFAYAPPRGLYYRDVQFLFIGFLFFASFSFTLSFVVLVFTSLFTDDRPYGYRTRPFLPKTQDRPPE